MITGDDYLWRRDHYWSAYPVDLCWLDCDQAGYIKQHGLREIILCMRHARLLEAGRFSDAYAGAPLPPDSKATEWPWLKVPDRVVSVV